MWFKEFFAEYQFMIVGITAIAAICFTIGQTWATRRHNRLSVKPLLNILFISKPEEKEFSIILENHGFGLAIIKNYKIIIGTESYEIKVLEDVYKVLQKVGLNKDDVYVFFPNQTSPLKGGGFFPLLVLPKEKTKDQNLVSKFYSAGVNFGFEFEIETLYKERFPFKQDPVNPQEEWLRNLSDEEEGTDKK